MAGVTDDDLAAAVAEALSPPETEEERRKGAATGTRSSCSIPEWRYLQKPALFPQQAELQRPDGHRDAARARA